MKKAKLTTEETADVLDGLDLFGMQPTRGVPMGPGPHCPVKETLTLADRLSGDPSVLQGWTAWGPSLDPDDGTVSCFLSAQWCDAVDGDEGDEKIEDKNKLEKIRDALKKAVPATSVASRDDAPDVTAPVLSPEPKTSCRRQLR